jgi:hypothetical protein
VKELCIAAALCALAWSNAGVLDAAQRGDQERRDPATIGRAAGAAQTRPAGDPQEPAKNGSPPQEAPATTPAEAAAPAAAEQVDEDEVIDPAMPDFTIVNLPTSARLPRFKSAFRVTHRFARPLGQGDFGDLISDFFGFDAGAQIGPLASSCPACSAAGRRRR